MALHLGGQVVHQVVILVAYDLSPVSAAAPTTCLRRLVRCCHHMT